MMFKADRGEGGQAILSINTKDRKAGLTRAVLDKGCFRPGNVIQEMEGPSIVIKELSRKTNTPEWIWAQKRGPSTRTRI